MDAEVRAAVELCEVATVDVLGALARTVAGEQWLPPRWVEHLGGAVDELRAMPAGGDGGQVLAWLTAVEALHGRLSEGVERRPRLGGDDGLHWWILSYLQLLQWSLHDLRLAVGSSGRRQQAFAHQATTGLREVVERAGGPLAGTPEALLCALVSSGVPVGRARAAVRAAVEVP